MASPKLLTTSHPQGVRYCHPKYCTFNKEITQYFQRFALFNIPSDLDLLARAPLQ